MSALWFKNTSESDPCSYVVTCSKLNSHLTCFQWGFIAQLVEHRTGITEVMGSNPIGASEFFLGFICNCLSYYITAWITFTCRQVDSHKNKWTDGWMVNFISVHIFYPSGLHINEVWLLSSVPEVWLVQTVFSGWYGRCVTAIWWRRSRRERVQGKKLH